MDLTMNEEDFRSPGAAALRIKKVIDEMPRNVAAAIFDDIPSSTMVGSAIRQKDGKILMDYLRSMNMEDMGFAGERLTHAAEAFESGDTLIHTPHCESLLRIIDAAAGQVHESTETHEEDSRAFYDLLNAFSPVIPGINSDGEPMAMEKFYFKESEDTGLDQYDVLSQAREALSADIVDEDTREYWEDTVRRLVPELREVTVIEPDEIPLSDAENVASNSATQWNETLGKMSGQLLTALTGSNRAEPPTPDSILDDTEEGDSDDQGDSDEQSEVLP
jgi:hypothetical protein